MHRSSSDKCSRRMAILVLICPYISINTWNIHAFHIGFCPNFNNFKSTLDPHRRIIHRDSYHRTTHSFGSRLQQTSKGRGNDSKETKSQTLRNVEEETPHEEDEDDFFDRLNGSRKARSLSDLEDEAERRLDLQTQLTMSKQRSVSDGQSFLLQHSIRAPSKSFSSSNTFERQEQLSTSSEDVDTLDRQEKIRAILAREDAKYKEERKRKKMGVYADATTMEDFKRKEEEERLRIQQGMISFFYIVDWNVRKKCMILKFHVKPIENEQKAKYASEVGVTLRLLEMGDRITDDSNFNPTRLKGSQPSSWFEELDSQLNSELEKDYLGKWDDSSPDEQQPMDDGPQLIDGVLVSKGERMGVSIGSAGKWSLEIFPGDFVVHRKYGIGRFERTVLKPKSKLTEAEVAAQTARRNQIIRNKMMDDEKSITSTELETIVSNFGTDDDLDPISNPRQTVLEVSYSDAVVHIPVEKAYRLSRYRAGDAVVKPRLSKVKGEAWAKAKRKVEENTLQIAQDVLALYATRETLQRSPYDPVHEGN